jgi:murein L,D-transpeptidase YafK
MKGREIVLLTALLLAFYPYRVSSADTLTQTQAVAARDHVLSLSDGQIEFDRANEISRTDPHNWAVMIYKARHELKVYFKGRSFKTYHAVFGRSLDAGAKEWEGDRRTPEGVYSIVAEHPSRRWGWFLRLNYPNSVDRERYWQLRQAGLVPVGRGHFSALGGEIGIHGTDQPILNAGDVNWTLGCISVDKWAIEELHTLLPRGTLVVIKP